MDIPYAFNERLIFRSPASELPLDKEISNDQLKEYFSLQKNAEALYLASPDLYASFSSWIENEKISEKDELKLKISLTKYYYRMHTRSTPFGLFSGCSIGSWSEKSNIERNAKQFSRFTSLDMKVTCSIIHSLNQSKWMRENLNYFPNSSIYEVQNNTLRYIEYKTHKGRRKYQIAEVKDAEIVKEVLADAAKGKSILKLTSIFKKYGYEKEEVIGFINELIDSQILVSELEPILIGPDTLFHVQNVLERMALKSTSKELLSKKNQINKLIQCLVEFDKKKVVTIEKHKKFIEQIKELDVPFEINNLLQVDMNIGVGKVEVSRKHQESMLNAITVLNKLNHYNRYSELDDFKDRFANRYGESEVNLGIALDSELGIGFSSNKSGNGVLNPLLNSFPNNQRNSNVSKINWSTMDSYLLKLYEESSKNPEQTVNLSSKDFEDFPVEWDTIPDSVSMMFKLLKKGNKEQLLMKSVGNSSATNLLSRFSGANAQIKELVEQIGNNEANLTEDVIHAEIAHLPQSRTGNVLQRPMLREFEIVYLSNSLKSEKQKILISDLFISVKNGRIILRSKKLNKEVIPHLSNAHNFTNDSLPVYHFLCELQYQNKRKGLGFNWGNFSKNLTFLPRVAIDDVIVYEATWQLSRKKYAGILKKENDLKKEVSEIQKKYNIPSKIRLCNSDNELYINLKHALDREIFKHEIKKRQSIILKEYLYDQYDSMVCNSTKKQYANEFVGILERKEARTKSNFNLTTSLKVDDTIQQNFYPGSEWCYLKLYCGVKSADAILTNQFKQLFYHLKNEKIIDKYFFIRYNDPEFHLRLRLKLVHNSLYGELMKHLTRFISDLRNSGLVWKSEISTYERELNRYGRKTMELSEEYFMLDTHFNLQLLDLESRSNSENTRWIGGIIAVDRILEDFGFQSLNEKMSMINALCDGYNKEFNYQKAHKVFIDQTFRKHSKELWNLFYDNDKLTDEQLEIVRINNEATQVSKKLVFNILEKFKNDSLEIELSSYVRSQIHMNLNRLFHSKARMNEFVIYNLLQKLYLSREARLKHMKKNEALIETGS